MTSVYERVAGLDLEAIDPELRGYFVGGAHIGRGVGVFEIAGCRAWYLRPLLAVLARQGVLFPERAANVPFEIVNTPTPGGGLRGVRTFHLPSGDRVLTDTLRVVDARLHDFMGRRHGFEVRLDVAVRDGGMRMQSSRQWLHLGRLRIRIPQLATVYVSETWQAGRRHVDVRLRSPVLGEWFGYAGSFDYR